MIRSAREDATLRHVRDGLPILLFADGAALADWLALADGAPGAWLMFAKKGTDATSLSRQAAIDAALCEGWIDGQTARCDDARFFLVRFTPRRPRGNWSEVNRSRAEQLIGEGRMRASGLREIEAARADGRWAAAYPPSSTAMVPPDLQVALDANPSAAARFAELNRTARYEMLLGLANARRAETRARRITTFVTAT